MNEMDARAHYTEHQRQMAWINDQDWKIEIEKPPRRSLRLALSKALLALARHIAPVYPEMERHTDAVVQPQ